MCRQLASAQVLASPCGSANDGGNQVALPAGLCLAVGNVQVGGSLARAAAPRVNGRIPPVVVASGLPGESEVISPISELYGDGLKCLARSQGQLITIGLERFEERIRSEAQLCELYEVVAVLHDTWCWRGLGIPTCPIQMARVPSPVPQGVAGLCGPLRPGVLAANARCCGPLVRGWLVFGGGGACGFRTPFDVWKMRVSRRPSWATWVRRLGQVGARSMASRRARRRRAEHAILANAYYATRADALSACWRTAKGPIAVAHLELRRIGWPRTTPFEFTDAEGNTYRLLHVSPNTIRHLLHRAALTHLAQQLARAPDQRRVLLGHVVKMLRSNTFSARQKGIIATVFAGGICARDCLRDAGYNAPPECELCGPTHGHTDSVHHRIWVCLHPDATAARDCASCAPALLRDARVSDPRDPHNVFVTGRGAADPYDWPTPTEHFEHVFQLSSPDGTLHAVPLAQ